MKEVQKHRIDLQATDPDCHNQSKVEGVIREMCKKWFRVMIIKKVPHILRDYEIKWVAEIMQSTSGSEDSLHYCTSLEYFTGETPDISEYLDFAFYYWYWYNDNAGLVDTKLGKWLSVSHQVGSLMPYWVITANGTVVSRTTVSRVTNIEDQTDYNKARIAALDKSIQERLNDKGHVIVEGGKSKLKYCCEHPFDCDPLKSTSCSAESLHYCMSLEYFTGETPDIS